MAAGLMPNGARPRPPRAGGLPRGAVRRPSSVAVH